MITVFVEIPLDERSNILTFPALIAFDRVNSLMGDFTNLAEWANHSFRTSVVATDPTTSRSNRAGTSFATGFPDILTPGTHESLLHHYLFFFLFLIQNVVSPCFFFLQELLFFFEKVFVWLVRRNTRFLPVSGHVFGSRWDFRLEGAFVLLHKIFFCLLSVHLWCQRTLSNLFICLKSMRHLFIFGPDLMLVLFILLVMVFIPLVLVSFECRIWLSSIQT